VSLVAILSSFLAINNVGLTYLVVIADARDVQENRAKAKVESAELAHRQKEVKDGKLASRYGTKGGSSSGVGGRK
jgi:hypothetical protein